MRSEAGAVLLILGAACAQQRVPESGVLAAVNEAELNRVVEGALVADAELDSADSLYAPFANVVADGMVRRGPPRYAGVSEGGEIAITTTQLQTRGTTAWGSVEYRWTSNRTHRVQGGRASLVLVPAQGRDGWWIVQAHSSSIR